jgi:filamentous hemagglutinin family protein
MEILMNHRILFPALRAAAQSARQKPGRMLGMVLQTAALASVVLASLSYQAVQAQSATLPQGSNVVQGQATISTNGNQMNVINTPGAIINWNSFNIGAGAGVNFQQQSINSSVMNRVTGGNISTIYGNLSSNGRVILVNPAGLVIGAGAVVDTAGFVGSTLNNTEANAHLDRLRFDAAGGAGRIQVDGVIRSPSGDIVLIAPDIGVGASALIRAPNGAVTLAAGQRVQLHGRGLEGITLELQAPSDSVLNLGRIEGEAVGMFASQLRHSGVIDARQASIEGGRIVLRAADQLTVTGTITADGIQNANGTGRGGNITLEGQTITLQGANISASGPAGGGTVSIGGGWQGRDSTINNASRTFVDQNTSIHANAQLAGNGGQIVVWSDGDTWFAGKIEAKGGELSGNGGRVEVSGKQRLGFKGAVNLTAAKGQSGSLLLDPKNIYIVNTGGATLSSTTVAFNDLAATDFLIDAASLSSIVGTVTLQASNDIGISSTIATFAGGTHLILEAGRSIIIDAAINPTALQLVAPNTLTIIANSSAPLLINRDPGLGSIVMTNNGSINMGANDSTVHMQVQNGSGGGGAVTLTNITATSIIVQAQTGINHAGGPTRQLAAERIVLSTNQGSIGTIANGIQVAGRGGNEVALSLYALDAGGNAFITSGTTASDIRLAPSALIGTASVQVGGTLSVVNQLGSIFVGAIAADTPSGTGTSNITASDIKLFSDASGGQIVIAQSNGQNLSINASGNMLLDTTSGNSANSILIGGTSSTGDLNINVNSQLNAFADGFGAGLVVQGGGSGGLTRIVVGNTTTLQARADVVVRGAEVESDTNVGVITLQSSEGGITIEAAGNRLALVQGRRVNLDAGDESLGNIKVLSGPGASARVLAGDLGLSVNAGAEFRVDSSNAGVGQSARVDAINGGSMEVTAQGVQVVGGAGANAQASISTSGLGTGSITINSGSAGVDIRTGSGNGSGATISSSGDVSVSGGPVRILNGGAKNSNTGIYAVGDVELNVDGLEISAALGGPALTTQYGIEAQGRVNVTSTGRIDVLGSGDADSSNVIAWIRGTQGVNLSMTNSSNGSIDIRGGQGLNDRVLIESASGNITLTSASTLNVVGGAGDGATAMVNVFGAASLTAPSIVLQSGSGVNAGALVSAGTNVNADASVRLTINNSNTTDSTTGISAAGSVNLNVGDLFLESPDGRSTRSSSGVTATSGVLSITATGIVSLNGNASPASTLTTAILSGGSGVSINAPSISLTGGFNAGNNVIIQSGGNTTLTGALAMDGNVSGSLALITTTGVLSLSQTPNFVVSGGQALIYAGGNSVTLALTYTGVDITTLPQASATNGPLNAILVPQPDVSTTIALPSGLPVGTTDLYTITFTNLSPLPVDFTATVVINGVTQSFPVNIAGNGQTSFSQEIVGTTSGATVSANVNTVSVVLRSTPLQETSVLNNNAAASALPLFADITTTLDLPAAGVVGSTVIATYTFINSGSATTTFTPIVVVDGFTNTGAPITLAPNAGVFYQLPVQVGTTGAVVSVSATGSTVAESGLSNNLASGTILSDETPIAPLPPVTTPPSVATPIVTPPVNVTPLIQDSLVAQTLIIDTIVPGGSTITVSNGGDTSNQVPDAQDNLQVDVLPICR